MLRTISLTGAILPGLLFVVGFYFTFTAVPPRIEGAGTITVLAFATIPETIV